MDEGKVQEELQSRIHSIKKAGTFKEERVITSSQQVSISVADSSLTDEVGQTEVLNFCANNYLGLSNDPRLIEAAKQTLDTHGFGLSSVRFICGTQDIHLKLEAEIAKFHGTDDTILYSSCFDANTGFFETILGKDDAIISDKLNHASIIDGIRLCKARRFLFNHMDMTDLEDKLREAQMCNLRVIATDGVFRWMVIYVLFLTYAV